MPVWVVLATGGLIAILSLATRRPGGRSLVLPFLLGPALLLAPAPANAAGPPARTSCTACHADPGMFEGAALRIVADFKNDVHARVGLSCHDCHGGNPNGPPDDIEAAHDEKKGWTGKPPRLRIPQLCARCHADAEFMKRFYRAMLQDRLPPAAALGAAQRSFRREKLWSAPYYWAAFTLQGEWE